jgi:hypothetical protein
MTHIMVLLAATALGVEAGWQPLPQGGHEYTIQIEPSLVNLLQSGNDIVSEVPAQVDVRRFRIKLGSGKLARIDGPSGAPVAEASPPPAHPADAVAKESTAPLWNDESDQTPTFGSTEEAKAPSDESLAMPDLPPPPTDDTASPSPAPSEPAMPANFQEPPADAQPLADPSASPAAPSSAAQAPVSTDDAQSHDTQKPALASGGDAEKPWLPLLLVIVFLACSLGANLYLGWIAYDARHRYRDALARVRTA